MVTIAEHLRQREELWDQFFHIGRVSLTVLPRDGNRMEDTIGMIEFSLLQIEIERREGFLNA